MGGSANRTEVLRPNRRSRSICFQDSVRALADSFSKRWCLHSVQVDECQRRMERARAPEPARPEVCSTSIDLAENLRGRICTCVVPLRRRRPELLGHAEQSEMDLAAGVPPATQRSKRCMIVISPREESGPPARNCTWNSTFARSRDRSFTTGRKKGRVLRMEAHGELDPPAGLAPASQRYKGRASLSTLGR